MARIVILGAGLTGLSTAYHLEQLGATDYAIFEKESIPGGLCRTVHSNGFTFDFTGHLLHSNDAATRPLVEQCVGKDNLALATRKSCIEHNGIQTPYPFQMHIHGHTPEVIAECIEGFVLRTKNKRQPRSYHEWVETAFGKGFGKHFFYPYQQKIFSYNPKKLTATWTGRFVPQTDLVSIIKGALTPQAAENIGYNATFLYPKQGGIYSLIKGLTNLIKTPVHTNFCATNIDAQRKIITFSNGHQEHYDQLVSTLPLDCLLRMLSNTSTQTVPAAANNLACAKVLNINLGITGNALPHASWVYYPDADVPWYRIGFPHTFSAQACPAGSQSLYAEFSYTKKPKNLAAAVAQAEKSVMQHFGIAPEHVATQAPLWLEHAYVIYNAWRDQHVPRILTRLTQDYAIHSIGRYGAWKYASMQEALLDGKECAHALTTTFKPAHVVRKHNEAPSISTITDIVPPLSIPHTGDEHEA